MMTKKIFFSLSLLILLTTATLFSQIAIPQQVAPQQLSIAFVNTTELLNALPEKAAATQYLLELSANYKRELELMQSEYNRKYSDFIMHQALLAENIKLRRMQELTELESRIRQFTELAQQDLIYQEQVLLMPLRQKIHNAIQAIGIEYNFTVIYDLANSAVAFLSPKAVDVNSLVKKRLGLN
jgi:outer membrane protein